MHFSFDFRYANICMLLKRKFSEKKGKWTKKARKRMNEFRKQKKEMRLLRERTCNDRGEGLSEYAACISHDVA